MLSFTTKAILRFYGYEWREVHGVEYYSITVKGISAFNSIMELKEAWEPWLRYLGKKAMITWHSEEEIAEEVFIGNGSWLNWRPQPNPELYRGETEGTAVITTSDIVVIITVKRWRG